MGLSVVIHPGGSPNGALWFQFSPNKDGPQDRVYVSQEWKEIVQYAVHALIHYSDEVRMYAPPAEKWLLILVSRLNWTAGAHASDPSRNEQLWEQIKMSPQSNKRQRNLQIGAYSATSISYDALCQWLNGTTHRHHTRSGILSRWNITVDGLADGEIYHLRTHQFRHMRQSALASDPNVSLLARQRDLNHRDPDMQLAYQHNLRHQQALLLDQARQGKFCGPGMI